MAERDDLQLEAAEAHADDLADLETGAVDEVRDLWNTAESRVWTRASAALPGAAEDDRPGILRRIAGEELGPELLPSRYAITGAERAAVLATRQTEVELGGQLGLPDPTVDDLVGDDRFRAAVNTGGRAVSDATDRMTAADLSDGDDLDARIAGAVRSGMGVGRQRAVGTVAWAINNGANLGRSMATEAAGVELEDDELGVLWVAERDACASCLAYSGQYKPAGTATSFPDGLTYGDTPVKPFGGSLPAPPLHPHCRCQLTPYSPSWGPGLPDALKREAERSVLRGWALPSESATARARAARRLLADGTEVLDVKSVRADARRRLRQDPATFTRPVPPAGGPPPRPPPPPPRPPSSPGRGPLPTPPSTPRRPDTSGGHRRRPDGAGGVDATNPDPPRPPRFRTKADASRWMRDELGVAGDLGSMKVAQAQQFADTVAELAHRFPETSRQLTLLSGYAHGHRAAGLASNVHRLAADPPEVRRDVTAAVNGGGTRHRKHAPGGLLAFPYGRYDDGEIIARFAGGNAQIQSRYDRLQTASPLTSRRWVPRRHNATTTGAGIVTHEYGHHVMYQAGANYVRAERAAGRAPTARLSDGPELMERDLFRIVDEWVDANPDRAAFYARGTDDAAGPRAVIRHEVSEYAGSNVHELAAETFAAVQGATPHGGAGSLARAIHDYIVELAEPDGIRPDRDRIAGTEE